MTDDADDDFGHDPPPDLPQMVASAADGGFTEDIQPERRFVLPITECQLITGQRLRADGASDGFAGWQAGGRSALEVARGKRLVGADLDDTGDGFRKADERGGKLSIDRLGTLCRWEARDIKEERPIDDVFRCEGPKPRQVGKDRKSLTAPAKLIVAFDL